MFQTLNNKLKGISDMGLNNEVNIGKAHYLLTTLPTKEYELILNYIINQETINNNEYAIYTKNILNCEFEYITMFESEQFLPINIDITNNKLVMNIILPPKLQKYINKNRTNKLLGIPVLYTANDVIDAYHAAIIIIYPETKKVYLIDSNGGPTYFNKIFEYNVDNYIESILVDYFNLIGYKFIPNSEWNVKNVAINKTFPDIYINNKSSSGHCVALTFLLTQILNSTKMTPNEVFNEFNNLSIEEILYIINNYEKGLYVILNQTNLDTINMINNRYDLYEKYNKSMGIDIKTFHDLLEKKIIT